MSYHDVKNGIKSCLPKRVRDQVSKTKLFLKKCCRHRLDYLIPRFSLSKQFSRLAPIITNRVGDIEIHILTSKADWLLAIWSLVSWYVVTGRSDPLVIHDDGTLTRRCYKSLHRLFPNAVIVNREEADRVVYGELSGYSACLEARRNNNMFLKLFDFTMFSSSNVYLSIDSDVLFFNSPDKLLDMLSFYPINNGRNCFQRDRDYSYVVSQEQGNELINKPFVPKICAGFGIIHKECIDLYAVESILNKFPALIGHAWGEQTVYALLSSKFGVDLFDSNYRIGLGDDPDKLVLRHYTRPIREHFFVEGIPYVYAMLRRKGLL